MKLVCFIAAFLAVAQAEAYYGNPPSEANKMANETTFWAINNIPDDPDKHILYYHLIQCSTCASLAEDLKHECATDCKYVINYKPVDPPTWLNYYCDWVVSQTERSNKPPPNKYPLCNVDHFYWIMQEILHNPPPM